MNKCLSTFVLLLLTFYCTAQVSEDQALAIDALFNEYNRTDMPGCAIAIVKDGNIIFEKGYGMADLEQGISIKPYTIFYAGSISKQFVTSAALLLSERGELDLTSEVQEYLPDFRRYDNPITVQDLIYHTSGIKDYFRLLAEAGLNYLNQLSSAEVYQLIKKQENLDFRSGDRYKYSNSGYLMLAMIIEKVSGMSLSKFIKKEIFEPLKMHHSLFLDDVRKLIPNRAWGYYQNVEGEIENMIMRFELVGSGGLYTTVGDLYLWDQNLYENKIGSTTFLDKLLTTGKLNDGKDTNYAFAIRKDKFQGMQVIGHSGSLGGYRAQFMQFPAQRFSIIILSNLANCKPGELAHGVTKIFLPDAFR